MITTDCLKLWKMPHKVCLRTHKKRRYLSYIYYYIFDIVCACALKISAHHFKTERRDFMSFTMVDSLNMYAKNMKMQMKWEQKKANSDYSSDGATSIADKLRQEAAEQLEALESGSGQATMSGIQAKLMAGRKLTSAEMEYLRKNDPDTYQQAKYREMERKAFEQRLRSCKTKEEVQRLKAAHMAASLDRVKDINNNPNISGGEKLKLTIEEHQKVCTVSDAATRFTESSDYKRLPTEAEKRKAEKDLKEAKEAEQKGETKKGQKIEKEKTKTPDAPSDPDSDKENLGEPTPADAQAAKAREIRASSKKTRAEAELTPEAQKVKRSRARASYTHNMHTEDSVVTIDVKR